MDFYNYYQELKPKQLTQNEFDILLSLGWYPMEQCIFTTSHLFRGDFLPPLKVYWLRYPVSSIREKASHRRIRSKNRHFEVEIIDPFSHSSDLDDLYKKYFDSINFKGFPTIEEATFMRGEPNIYNTKAIIVRDSEQIMSCGIFHKGKTSVASILHFYDPGYKGYSPGKYLILKTLDFCKQQGIKWYYPGYIINGDSKMYYKLFLGENIAQYYNPVPDYLSGNWLPFTSDLLT